MTVSDTDELLDLVNDKDEVIGTILRSNYSQLIDDKLGYIREVALFIQNDRGEFWIPMRTADKKIAPNGLDYSAAGHVSSGESYMEAALREIHEELNLDLTPEDLTLLRKFRPSSIPYFKWLYVYHSNETPSFNPRDFISAEWLSPIEIMDKINSGIAAKTSLRETMQAILT